MAVRAGHCGRPARLERIPKSGRAEWYCDTSQAQILNRKTAAGICAIRCAILTLSRTAVIAARYVGVAQLVARTLGE